MTSISTLMSLAADEFDPPEDGAFGVAGNEPIRPFMLPNDGDSCAPPRAHEGPDRYRVGAFIR